MKRYIAALLVTVLLVPLLAVPVSAASLNMSDAVPNERMPAGYVYPTWKGFSSSIGQPLYKDLFFYDANSGYYFSFSFNGTCTFINDRDTGYLIKFSDPGSLVVRAYECMGRDIFSFTEEHKMVIKIPSSKLAEIVTGETKLVVDGLINTHPYHDYSYISTISGTKWSAQFMADLDMSVTIDIPVSEINLNALDIPITVEEFASKNIDYYVVHKSTSNVTSSIDFGAKWFANSSGYFCLTYPTVNMTVRGWPISMSVYTNDSSTFYYDNGAYYSVFTAVGSTTLLNSELMSSDYKLKLPLSYLNQFLMHFGYDAVYYSEQNAQLSSDIGAVGGTIGGWTSSAGDYTNQANSSISGVKTSITSFQTVFLGVWNILPAWFLSLMAVVFVIIIGRKILGR